MQAMADIKCVVFDVDDTLYLEGDYVRSGFTHVDSLAMQLFDARGFGDQCWQAFESGVRGNTFDQVARLMGLPWNAEIKEQFVFEYRNHKPDICLASETRQVLTSLRQQWDIGLLTGGYPQAQRQKIASLQLHDLAEHIVFAGELGPEFDKPHPWGWLQIEELTQLAGASLVYVGDNPVKDWSSSAARGWQFVRIRLRGSLHYDKATPEGVEEIGDISELSELLTR